MKTKLMRLRRTFLLVFSAGLLLGSAAPLSWAQSGLFVSATPQTPISLGDPLNITVVVKNTDYDPWLAGDTGVSWLTDMDRPSWSASWSSLEFYTTATVNVGATATMVVTLPSLLLPSLPGSYAVRLATAYNWLDVQFFMMSGSPKTVNFTINSPPTNHAPVIAPIGDKAVVETNLLSFTVSATDTDLPPQTLTFSLDAGAPAGASINPTNGAFAWTPPAGSTPRTNQFTVRVTDNGSPPLSATNTFTVVVLKPPHFVRISRPTNNVVTLVWESFPGKTYQVGYRENVTSGSWTNLGSDIVASNSLLSVTNSMGGAPQRFYRLQLRD